MTSIKYNGVPLWEASSQRTEMNPIDTIRERALKLLVSDDPETLGKASELLKTASDLELQQANTAKLEADRKKVEQDLSNPPSHWKELLTTSIPLATTVILAGTFIFQIVQNRHADADKRAEVVRQDQQREETRFTDALKLIQTSENISPAASLLNTFTKEPQKTEARQMALKLLLRSQSMDDFREIFSATIEPVGPADLQMLIQLNRSVGNRLDAIPSVYDPATLKDDPTKVAKLDTKTSSARAFLSAENVFLSQRIALLLQRLGEKTSEIDLTDLYITNADIRGVNLHMADLSNIAFTSVRMEGCDLSGVTRFQNTKFYFTAWWHADRVSQPLLEYLEQTAPYDKRVQYPGATQESVESYKQDLSRLKSSLGQV